MKEAIKNYYPLYKIFSINNNINPTVDILIESIDRFSFGEDSDDENISKNEKEEQKMRKNGPNNFGYIKAGNNLIESNTKLKDLNDIINGIEELKILSLEEKKPKGKICGIFNKEDFEIKLDEDKKNKLNDSFEKKYNNPLKNILDTDEDEYINKNNFNNNNKNNNRNDIKININLDKKEEKKIEKVEKEEEKINEEIKNKENKLLDSNSKIKRDNYESDDMKNPENEKTIKENIKENEILKVSKEEEEKKEEESIPSNKDIKELNEISNNPINCILPNKNNEKQIESPRLGDEHKEKQEIKKIEEEKIIKEKEKEPEKIIEIENTKNKNEEKQININVPLNKKDDNKYQKVKEEELKIPKKEEKNKNLLELKENSFIIKQSTKKEKKENDLEETNKKILELTQKLEKSEKETQKMKEETEKLLEVINMFRNLQSIEIKKTPNSGKNSRSDTPKRQVIKKRCYTPTLSRTNIIYGNAPIVHHKRSNSYNKIRIVKNNENNDNKLYIDYIPIKQKTYRQLHGKENNQKKGKKINQKINVNNNPKMYGNYINRNTIYLTGANSNKYAKSPYLNNNMNYTGISYNNNINNKKNINSYNNYVYMNNSSQSFFINNNRDDAFGNIYQRQVMQLPPNEQPLFYETKSFMINNNNAYQVYNKNINYNSENNFNRYKNIIENNNKYLQEMPLGFNNSNDLSLNNHLENKKKNKNKLLDFKDFQIIFDESGNNHNVKSNQIKSNEDKNIINSNNFSKNNNSNNPANNNNNYPNNNYEVINYRDYSLYKLNEFNNNLNNDNANNFDMKKNLEKLSKGLEDDNNFKKKSKGKNDNFNNLNYGIINNFNKNKKKTYTNNNEKNLNQNNNLNSKEFGRNRDKIDYNNCLNDSDDFDGIIKDKKNNRKKENLDKSRKDYMLPFYLINRNDMLNNIINFINNDKLKKRINNPINDKKKNN